MTDLRQPEDTVPDEVIERLQQVTQEAVLAAQIKRFDDAAEALARCQAIVDAARRSLG